MMFCKLFIYIFPKLGSQETITAKAAQLLCLEKYSAGITPLPSQIIQAAIMPLYAAVTAFALASYLPSL